ncbi:hypothetical protein Taro_029887 [Colocasia esculenta]|uniref:Uncharacterized protein n=1 Tax=Colocasia esculenta TaxID=4460 RepID=A0A843VEY2_COLES|nr:hypothetical protein [Colocasia esculenta]
MGGSVAISPGNAAYRAVAFSGPAPESEREKDMFLDCSPGKELLRLFGAIWRFGGVLVALSTRGLREEWGKCRAIHGFHILHGGRDRSYRCDRISHHDMSGWRDLMASLALVALVAHMDSFALLSLVVRRLFRNASAVRYPRFCVSQARVFVVLRVCPDTYVYCRGARHGPVAVWFEGVVFVGLHYSLACVDVERQLDLTSVTARLRVVVPPVVVCHGVGTVVIVVGGEVEVMQ